MSHIIQPLLSGTRWEPITEREVAALSTRTTSTFFFLPFYGFIDRTAWDNHLWTCGNSLSFPSLETGLKGCTVWARFPVDFSGFLIGNNLPQCFVDLCPRHLWGTDSRTRALVINDILICLWRDAKVKTMNGSPTLCESNISWILAFIFFF